MSTYLRNAIASFVGGSIVGALYILPHTIYLEDLRKLLSIIRFVDKKEAPLHPNILQRVEDVMRDLELTEEEKRKIRVFSAYGYDTIHLGSIEAPYGAVLGIGANLSYIDVQRIDKEQIKILGEPIDWSREDAQICLAACTLSDEAQRYLLARDILKLKSINLVFETELADVSTILAIFTQNEYLKAYPVSEFFGRLFIRFLFVTAMYNIWGILYDLYNSNILHNNDEKIVKLGPAYVRGGKEYYEKCLARNLSFRTLLPMGNIYITSKGETRTLIRRKAPVINDKIAYFTAELEKLNEGKESGATEKLELAGKTVEIAEA